MEEINQIMALEVAHQFYDKLFIIEESSSDDWVDLQFIKSKLASLLEWACKIETEKFRRNPEYPLTLYNQKAPKSIEQMEQQCKALSILLRKPCLGHRERTAILFIYSKFGKAGEQRIHQILSKCANYNFDKTQYYIDQYKKRGKIYGIGCDKLIEWGICEGRCEEYG